MPNLETCGSENPESGVPPLRTGQLRCDRSRLPPPGTDGNPIIVIVFNGIIQRQEESHGGDGTLKRSRGYSNDGYGGGNGNGRTACRQANEWDGNDLSTTMMISLTAIKTTINKKYNKEGWM